MPFEHSPDDIIVTWGEHTFSAFGADSRCTAKRLQPLTKMHVGNDGVVTVTMNSDQTGEVTIVLVQGSDSNTELVKALQLQESTKKLQKRPLTITDLRGNTLITCPNAWLVTFPDHESGADAKERSWVLQCDKLLPSPGVDVTS